MGNGCGNKVARHVKVTGVVQGVGFRPFVYTLAQRFNLTGWVLNHSGGVDIEIEGAPNDVMHFLQALRDEAPPLAHVTRIDVQPVVPDGYERFEIRQSVEQAGQFLLISPDVATCADCLRELFDPDDRRYRYPFINCTNCGPRFTIIEDIPYDRPKTTMRIFPLCEACREEYENPANRRFHAQPNACATCGPHLWLTDAQGRSLVAGPEIADNEAVLSRLRQYLREGAIVALKGLGGFQLVCDATQLEVVARLRERKRRPDKPFAVMMQDLDQVRHYTFCSEAEAAVLQSPQAPIVLLRQRSDAQPPLAEAVAPRLTSIGVMLPYTPLHHLVLRDYGLPLVMTSGNLSEEPIAKDNGEALERLDTIADVFLFHNRDIYARYDDSVVQVLSEAPSRPYMLRRARGYAPFPVTLPHDVGQLLAVGPHLKNTFALTRERYAFVSQHIGDLDDWDTLQHYQNTLETYLRLFRMEPQRVVCDSHPDYLSTRIAEEFARERNLPAPTRVQHHRAHIAACLADNGWSLEQGPVIGIALDGTGYGDDGLIWGGEWFIGDYRHLERVFWIEPLPLPGGEAAIHQPWRIAIAYVLTLAPHLYPDNFYAREAPLIQQQIARGLNVPYTTSMGRLFDAVSALLGVRPTTSYEAQAAIELQHLAAQGKAETAYPFTLEGQTIRLSPLFEALLQDRVRDVAIPDIAARFHLTITEMILQTCEFLRTQTGISTVALSGGVFQNDLLLNWGLARLRDRDFNVLIHRQVPCNDGGIALGQAILGGFQA